MPEQVCGSLADGWGQGSAALFISRGESVSRAFTEISLRLLDWALLLAAAVLCLQSLSGAGLTHRP